MWVTKFIPENEIYIKPATRSENVLQSLQGHYFCNIIRIATASEYINTLRNNKVIISRDTRMSIIKTLINTVLPEGVEMIEDQELLNKNFGITEFPTVFLCQISEKYMALPKAALISTIKYHQRYIM